MPDLSASLTEHKLSDVFAWLQNGELALPELQRESVWSPSKIPDLLDSVYRDYPIGIMLIWTPREGDQIRCRRFDFESEQHFDTQRTAKHYLIDGQQRLTSFYLALHEKGGLGVAFNIVDEEFSLIDGQIKSMLDSRRKYGWYRLRELLSMDDQRENLMSQLQREQGSVDKHAIARFAGPEGTLWRLLPNKISLGFYRIQDRSYGEVAEIFDRINRGTQVKPSQIVLGKLSTIYPGIVENVEQYLETSRDKHGSNFDLDFFVATLAVIYTEISVLPDEFGEDDQEELKSDVEITKKAIDRALQFMDRRLFMNTMKYIPSPRTLTCLTYLLHEFSECRGNGLESHQAAFWVARSLLIGHHGDQRWYKQDIAEMRESETFPRAELEKNLRAHRVKTEIQNQYDALGDFDNAISRSDILSDFVYAMLRWKGAVSFPSLKPIQAIRVSDENDDEEVEKQSAPGNPALRDAPPMLQAHHIYPLGRLKQEFEASEDNDDWFEKRKFDDMANITWILISDNAEIGDAPIEYLNDLDADRRERHFIRSRSYRTGDYRKLLTDRREMIKKALREYLSELELKANP